MPRRSPSFYEGIRDDTLAAYLRHMVRIPLLSKKKSWIWGDGSSGGRAGISQAGGGEPSLRGQGRRALPGLRPVAPGPDQRGQLGLLEAARRFSPDRGVKFITYAVWWIRQAMHAGARLGRRRSPVADPEGAHGIQIPGVRSDMEQSSRKHPATTRSRGLEPPPRRDGGNPARLERRPRSPPTERQRTTLASRWPRPAPSVGGSGPDPSRFFETRCSACWTASRLGANGSLELRFGLGTEEPQPWKRWGAA